LFVFHSLWPRTISLVWRQNWKASELCVCRHGNIL
jgi:hypothetical protein